MRQSDKLVGKECICPGYGRVRVTKALSRVKVEFICIEPEVTPARKFFKDNRDVNGRIIGKTFVRIPSKPNRQYNQVDECHVKQLQHGD